MLMQWCDLNNLPNFEADPFKMQGWKYTRCSHSNCSRSDEVETCNRRVPILESGLQMMQWVEWNNCVLWTGTDHQFELHTDSRYITAFMTQLNSRSCRTEFWYVGATYHWSNTTRSPWDEELHLWSPLMVPLRLGMTTTPRICFSVSKKVGSQRTVTKCECKNGGSSSLVSVLFSQLNTIYTCFGAILQCYTNVVLLRKC